MANVLAGLSEKGRQVAHFLMWAAREGLSGHEVLEILRAQGLGYREQVFYQDWRIVRGVVEKSRALEHVPFSKRISEEAHEFAEYKVSGKYVYVLELTVNWRSCADRKPLHTSVEYVTIYFDYRPTRAELCAKAESLFSPAKCLGDYDYFGELVKCVPRAAYINTSRL